MVSGELASQGAGRDCKERAAHLLCFCKSHHCLQVNHLAYFRGISTDGPNLSLMDLPIVKNIAILNCGVIIILTCGFVSLLLIYIQVIRVKNQAKLYQL